MDEPTATNGSPTVVRNSPHKTSRLFVVLAIVALANSPALFSDFFLDDYFNLENALDAGWSWDRLTQGFTIAADVMHDGIQLPVFKGKSVRYFRPVFLASLVLDHLIWGLQPFGFHLTNLLLHLLLVMALYFVLRELIPDRPQHVLVGTLIYGLMHYHGLAVGWLSGRTELWPALAMLIALLCWLRFGRTRAWWLYGLSIAVLAFGLLAKENAVVFPVLALAAWLWVMPRPRPTVWLIAPYAALVGGYFALRAHLLGGFPLPPICFYYHSVTEPIFPIWFVAKSACVFFNLVFSIYLVYPIELLLAMRPATAVGLFAVAAAIAVGILLLVRGRENDRWRRQGYFAIAWVFVGMAPTAPLMIAAFYFYFPLCGITILYIVLWNRLLESERPRWFWKGRRPQVAVGAVAVLLFLELFGGQLVLKALGDATRHAMDQVAEAVGPPDNQRIFLLDVPWTGAYARGGLRLRGYGSDVELHLLSGDPRIIARPATISDVRQIDERSFEIEARDRLYWTGVMGIAATGDRGPEMIKEGDVYRAADYSVEITELEKGGLFNRNAVRKFTYRFNKPLSQPENWFLRWTKDGVERIKFHQ